jgi:glyoxylase-like metal-dependent hydrolase (beta-lactamase superfamily II)
MEVAPGINLLKVPIPGNSLGFINAYLVKSGNESMLIDTGWNTDESFNSLTSQLNEIGVSYENLKYIAITHTHPDHYGLVGRLEKFTNAKLVIHELERSLLTSRYTHTEHILDDMQLWLEINGVPDAARPLLQNASMAMLGLVAVALPDIIVRGGEHLKVGDYDFEILWTPGHSPGHICFYERNQQVLFSGDFILPRITPNISMHAKTIGNPLVDYLSSLHQVMKLPAKLILPSHGDPFEDLPKRAREIMEHHEKRMQDILKVFSGKPETAYQIASEIPWSKKGTQWDDLTPLDKRMAITETLAHLELMTARGSLIKDLINGLVWYEAA